MTRTVQKRFPHRRREERGSESVPLVLVKVATNGGPVTGLYEETSVGPKLTDWRPAAVSRRNLSSEAQRELRTDIVTGSVDGR